MSNTERQIAEQAPSPQQVLMQIPQGMWVAQCVATAARLGIADALAELQPQRSDTLARAVGADASALARLLRALASLGVLAASAITSVTCRVLTCISRPSVPLSTMNMASLRLNLRGPVPRPRAESHRCRPRPSKLSASASAAKRSAVFAPMARRAFRRSACGFCAAKVARYDDRLGTAAVRSRPTRRPGRARGEARVG